MKNRATKILVSIALTMTSLASAQSGMNQNQVIVKDANTTLGEVNKTFEKITEFPPEQSTPVITYEPGGEVLLNLPRLDSKTKVVPLKTDALVPAGMGYVRGGLGNYATTYLELYLAGRKVNNLSWFTRARHKASGNGPVKFARSSDNLLEGGLEYSLKKQVIGIKTDLSRFRYNYYGFDNSIGGIREDSLKLLFHKIHVRADFKNKNEGDKLHYKAMMDVFQTGNRSWSELEVLPAASFRYRIDTLSGVGLETDLALITQKDSLSRSRQLFTFTPYYERFGTSYKVKGGLSFQYTSDTLNDVKGLHLYPVIYGEYYLLPNTASVFAEIGGGIVKNTLRSTLSSTPYLERDIHIANSNRRFEASIGLRNRIKSNVHLTIKGVFGQESNFLVLANGLDSSRLAAVYDPGKVSYSGIDLGIQIQVTKAFQSSFQSVWRNYNTDTLDYAWHRPGANLQWRNKFNLREKLYFTADFYYISNLRGLNLSTGKSTRLKDIADLNLGVEYRFSKNFAAFISANNILGTKYQRYLYYPNNGFGILGGLSYNF